MISIDERLILIYNKFCIKRKEMTNKHIGPIIDQMNAKRSLEEIRNSSTVSSDKDIEDIHYLGISLVHLIKMYTNPQMENQIKNLDMGTKEGMSEFLGICVSEWKDIFYVLFFTPFYPRNELQIGKEYSILRNVILKNFSKSNYADIVQRIIRRNDTYIGNLNRFDLFDWSIKDLNKELAIVFGDLIEYRDKILLYVEKIVKMVLGIFYENTQSTLNSNKISYDLVNRLYYEQQSESFKVFFSSTYNERHANIEAIAGSVIEVVKKNFDGLIINHDVNRLKLYFYQRGWYIEFDDNLKVTGFIPINKKEGNKALQNEILRNIEEIKDKNSDFYIRNIDDQDRYLSCLNKSLRIKSKIQTDDFFIDYKKIHNRLKLINDKFKDK